MKTILWIFSLLCGFSASAQALKLPVVLREISGLERLDSTHFVAINDGGNAAEIYVINKEGTLLKTVIVRGAENQDWEDLASDGTHLYIGDFGNNLNRRKDLCVYKVELKSILSGKSVDAQKISFSYADQQDFPPKNEAKRFDAEGFAFYAGKLWIFTKVNDDPWTGKCSIYELPVEPGTYSLEVARSIVVGEGGWWEDAITGADVKEGTFFLTTYNRVIMYRFIDGLAVNMGSYHFPESTQKESILVEGAYIWVADEYQSFLGGGKLYKIPLNAFKRVNEPK